MKKLIGHEFVFNKLIGLYKNNKLPNKILLSGKKGIGKSLLANQIVNYIVLGLAIIFESWTFFVAVKEFKKSKTS